MKVLKLAADQDVRLAQAMALQFGRQCGLAVSNDVVDQLVDQVREQRLAFEATVARVRADFERHLAEMRANLDEVKVLRAELDATKAELAAERAKRAQLQVLAEWPSERTRLQ